ncbi:hypothetical protein [Marinomonas algicola]|uniref:hypothetical protein n=1 Tax=Marinomonas algicola TaxID=2773454 RepID=UPI00174B7960|nr:hypothetical protein [Marinomonas algicola]
MKCNAKTFSALTCVSLYVLALFAFISMPAWSADVEGVNELEWWAVSHKNASQTVSKWSNGLDAFFSGESSTLPNQSFVSLEMGGVFTDTGNSSPFLGLHMGVRLPNTKDRLRLVIDSDANELTENNKIQEATSSTFEKEALGETFSAAIRYVKTEWNANFDAGILVDFPLDPFVRVRFTQDRRYSSWSIRLRESIFSYYSQGFGISFTSEATTPLTNNLVFGTSFGSTWLNREETYYYRENVFLNHSINDHNKIRYQFSVLQSGDPAPDLDTYLYSINYKRVLYRNWLIGQVTPQMTHESDNDFDPEFSLTLSLEILLGEDYLSSSIRH